MFKMFSFPAVLLTLFVLLTGSCKNNQNPLWNLDFKIVNSNNILTPHEMRAKFYVITFFSPECPLCQMYAEPLKDLKDSLKDKNIVFMEVFSGNAYDKLLIKSFIELNHYTDEILINDSSRAIQKAFSATITPEVFVLDHNCNVVYKGKIDNKVESLGVKRAFATQFYLKDALISLLNGNQPKIKETKAVGCFIE